MDSFNFLLGFATLYVMQLVRADPTILVVARAAAAGSGGNAVAAVVGASCGAVAWAVSAALGMHGVMSQSPWIVAALYLFSGGALLCLGIRLIWDAGDIGAALMGTASATEEVSSMRVFDEALSIKFADVKIVIVYFTLFQITIPPGSTGLYLAALAVIFVSEVVWFGLAALLFSTGVARHAYDHFRPWIDRLVGTALVAQGLWLIVSWWS